MILHSMLTIVHLVVIIIPLIRKVAYGGGLFDGGGLTSFRKLCNTKQCNLSQRRWDIY